jgi:hypothetical protein
MNEIFFGKTRTKFTSVGFQPASDFQNSENLSNFELNSKYHTLALYHPQSIPFSSQYGVFLKSDFGWIPSEVDLVEVPPENIYYVNF